MFYEYSKKLVKRRKFVVLAVLIASVCLTILNTDLSPDLYFLHWTDFENISCHYSDVGDALTRIEDGFEPPSKSIYFHETSCRGWLNSRQACAVESAARAHPKWQIHLLFAGPVTETNLNKDSLGALKQFDNIKLLRLHLVNYAMGTPLEGMVSEGALNRTRWRISHTSDVLRYLSLYKWGGVYLDLDVVVVKSFEDLVHNWAAQESDATVAAGALAFSRDQLGREVADAAIRDFKQKYRGDVWGNNGPGVITRIMQRLCDTTDVNKMTADRCQGFQVYGTDLFYPISWSDALKYFNSEDLNIKEPYTYHIWNKLTQDMEVKSDSNYAKIARKYCPTIYELYGDTFGM